MPEVCKIKECGRRKHSRGWCKLHYERNRKWGTTDKPEKPHAMCAIEGCSKPGRSKTAAICPMHYHRIYRTGSTSLLPKRPQYQDISGKRYGTLTARKRIGDYWECVCDCGGTRLASIGELNRTGEANTCGDKTEHRNPNPSYPAAHARLRADLGAASSHPCAGCGEQAAHWSYNHDDPNEMYYDDPWSGSVLAYSAKQDSYSPRCVPCHKRFDLDRINSNGATQYAA